MFEIGPKGQMVVPQNWSQMVEENNLWLLAERCMEILNITHILDENTIVIDVQQRKDTNRFIDGLLLSTQEDTISQSNWATTSDIEKGRMEGSVRRAMHMASINHIPWALVKHSKSSVTPVLNYTDSLYLRLASIIQTKTHHQKISMWLTKLYNSAMVKLAKACKQPITDYVLSFDEVWASIGDTKKDAGGRVKLDKAGNPKRYHPSKPDFNGMEKAESLLLKNSLSDVWESIAVLRHLWQANTEPNKYAHYTAAMRAMYSTQVKSVKAVKALADSRIEALGLPRTAPKAAISNRKAQRIATGDYKPVYGTHELNLVSTSAELEMYKSLLELNNNTGDWSEANPRADVESRISVLTLQKKALISGEFTSSK